MKRVTQQVQVLDCDTVTKRLRVRLDVRPVSQCHTYNCYDTLVRLLKLEKDLDIECNIVSFLRHAHTRL